MNPHKVNKRYTLRRYGKKYYGERILYGTIEDVVMFLYPVLSARLKMGYKIKRIRKEWIVTKGNPNSKSGYEKVIFTIGDTKNTIDGMILEA